MQVWMIVSLTLLYLALTGNVAANNLVVGVLLAVGVTALLHPDRLRITPRQVPTSLWALLRYGWVLVKDMLQGAWQVARLVLHRDLPVRPAVIALSSDTESRWATALSAHAITLSPGALVIEIGEHGVMYTHVLEADKAEQSVAELQRLRSTLLEKILPDTPRSND